ncbi:signal peptidase I [Candidatus Curtissbacteria bacterium RBG_16_39_7]|uniref:Signal peptidase I n=1 Tax=Candidatus Curtissbacteria bacterium RBG_16_39_7 TaxID=1797707 RepID=A0A1F5G2K9_9BACT|nr:MAG: signal peptidase I [Candidatus Curtissbacteria bacterium RBG_16_39_7]
MNLVKQLFSFFTDIFETIIIALAIFLVVYLFLVQPHRVQGDSMLPNFKNGELILTDKISYRIRPPQRGNVIVFKAPYDKSKDFIKRIIGLPGEKIKVENGGIFVNNKKVSESYLPDSIKVQGGSILKEGEEYSIPQEEYVVFGDNRAHSSDSREFGPVPKKDIIGKAFFVYWPPNAFAFITQVSY